MTEQEVVFGPIDEPVPTTDWRWQEILAMEPFKVLEELKELDTALFNARSEQREAVRELADLEDVLYRAKQEALEAITLKEVRDRLFKGGTKDERKERQEMHLAEKPWVQESEAEIKVARERKDNAQVALDSMLDRQVNLGKFANMYSATARLLASIRTEQKSLMVERMPENQFEDLLAFIAELRREGEETKEAVVGLRSLYGHIIRIFAGQPENSIHSAISSVYEEAQAWVRWSKDAVGEPPVDTSALTLKIMQVVKPMQASPDLEPVLEDEVLDALAMAGVEVPLLDDQERCTVEIPASMAATEEEAAAMKVAIERHREAFEEELPFQPDEDLSL